MHPKMGKQLILYLLLLCSTRSVSGTELMSQHTIPNVFKVSCRAALENIPLSIEQLLEVLTDPLNHVMVGSRLLHNCHTQLIQYIGDPVEQLTPPFAEVNLYHDAVHFN